MASEQVLSMPIACYWHEWVLNTVLQICEISDGYQLFWPPCPTTKPVEVSGSQMAPGAHLGLGTTRYPTEPWGWVTTWLLSAVEGRIQVEPSCTLQSRRAGRWVSARILLSFPLLFCRRLDRVGGVWTWPLLRHDKCWLLGSMTKGFSTVLMVLYDKWFYYTKSKFSIKGIGDKKGNRSVTSTWHINIDMVCAWDVSRQLSGYEKNRQGLVKLDLKMYFYWFTIFTVPILEAQVGFPWDQLWLV